MGPVVPPEFKIVSLLPSATEIVCRLGLKSHLVGISHECDFPEDLGTIPKLTRPKLDPNQRGRQIHESVVSMLKNSLSIYEVDTEKLASLAPDLIITQDQCKVCAVSLEEVERAVCDFTKKQTKICSLSPHCLDDIHRDFLKVGLATNQADEAKNLITEFWIQLNSINAKVGTDLVGRPKVLCLEWLEPLMVGGGWIPELVKLAGAEPLIVNYPEKFKTVSWSQIQEADPDYVVIFPCGYPISKTADEIKTSKELSELNSLRAMKEGRVFICDGNHYFNRPGPRIPDSCEILASLFFPEKFVSARTKHSKKSFIKWSPNEK